MTARKFAFETAFARRMPDPVFHKDYKIERHFLMVPIKHVPMGLPYDPNARRPNTRRRVYQDIQQSLLNGGDNTPGTFHLKHKGITLIAESVAKSAATPDRYIVTLKPGQGLMDGGNTYELITNNISNPDLPDDQFVKFEIITNLPEEWTSEIAGGLNTSVQVEDMSLDDLAGKFDWIKKELEQESYFSQLAWREGEEGEYDARYIVALMTCFLIDEYPNSGSEHPVLAYEKKSAALELFEKKSDVYMKVRPILKDILVLHDTLALEAREKWNAASGGKAGSATFMEKRKRGKFDFLFIDKQDDFRLSSSALFPMLAAFRWMVEDTGKKGYRWRGGFQTVLDRWNDAAPELMRSTFEQNKDSGRTPNALGKSRPHWNNLHTKLAKLDQDMELAELRKKARVKKR